MSGRQRKGSVLPNNSADGSDGKKTNNNTRNAKRKRSNDDEQQQMPAATKPKPPPPPPAALVKLLRTNKSVFQYFQALHANLEYDVQKWKTRAKQYQSELETLQIEKDEMDTEAIAQRSTKDLNAHPQSQRANEKIDDDDDEASLPPPVFRNKANPIVEQQANIDKFLSNSKSKEQSLSDNEFRLSFSSSDDDDDEKDQSLKQRSASQTPKTTPTNSKIDDPATKATTNVAAAMKRNATTVGIRNALFNASSSDDSDAPSKSFLQDQATHQRRAPRQTAPTQIPTSLYCSSDSDDDPFVNQSTPRTQQEILQAKLRKNAEMALERLGISLWTLEEVATDNDAEEVSAENKAQTMMDSTNNDQSSDDGENITSVPTQQWKPLSKLQVVGDILRTIKELTRIKDVFQFDNSNDNSEANDTTTTELRYFPFMTSMYLPCFWDFPLAILIPSAPANAVAHPAKEGAECLFSILSFLDLFHFQENGFTYTYHHPIVRAQDGEDVHPPTPPSLIEWAQVATKSSSSGSTNLVEEFINSLHGEIIRVWPVQERAKNKNQPVELTFAPAEQKEVALAADNTTAPSILSVKHLVRLASLVEKCILVNTLIRLYLRRGDHDRAAEFALQYISTTLPMIGANSDDVTADSEKDEAKRNRSFSCCQTAPILSFCILEAIFDPFKVDNPNWFTSALTANSTPAASNAVIKIISMAVRAAAAIHRVRRESTNDRLHALSEIELVSYQRLHARCPWLNLEIEPDGTNFSLGTISNEAWSIISTIMSQNVSSETSYTATVLQIAMQLCASDDTIRETFQSQIVSVQANGSNRGTQQNGGIVLLLGCCNAFRQSHIARLEQYHINVSSSASFDSVDSMLAPSHQNSLPTKIVSAAMQSGNSELLATAAWCCNVCADGENLFILARSSFEQKGILECCDHPNFLMTTLFTVLRRPVVRVINLERRKDRMTLFMTQAMLENILVIKAVASPGKLSGAKATVADFSNAVDGLADTMANAEMGLVRKIGSLQLLNDQVDPEWRPSDLRAFDANAPESEHLVRISPTEKACALSHIASWRGCLRCLSVHKLHEDGDSDLPQNWSNRLLEQFGSAGYAHGPAFLHKNEDMNPQPVCIIMEDDAIMVDRFSDRLASLLEELPRDFHFCSLGYGRPKTAPLIPYSSQIGIPTSIWYLTGYILSLEGAKLLLDSLPVRGPVDSWIGLKMFANWDNTYGYKMGVGSSAVTRSDAPMPSRKELSSFLHFRAFAALTPLCSQKVHGSGPTESRSLKGQSWRNRDTDIVYSGVKS